MPKLDKLFTHQVNVKFEPDVYAMVKAIGYYRGEGGAYSSVIRDFVAQGVARFLDGLDERGRERFERILSNVRTSEAMRES